MVDTVTDKLRTINLSAKQLKLITKNQGAQWADDLINEFLNYLININEVAGSTDELIVQVNLNTGDISVNVANIATNVIDIAANTADIVTNTLGIAQNADDIVINAAAIVVVAGDLSDHELSN
jgi:esterase/lipase